MKNLFEILAVPADRPVPPHVVEMIGVVDGVMQRLDVKYVVAGATARDLVLWHVHGIKEERATADVDVAMCAVSWERFNEAVAALIATGRFSAGASQHTLRFATPSSRFPIPLDIVPFGGLEEPAGQIRWQPDGDVVMGVLGFDEAIRTALPIRIGADVIAPVASPAALVVLKVIAWSERGDRKNTDAPDVLYLAKNYTYIVDDEIYDAAYDGVMEKYDYRHAIASAEVLGRDARNLASATTRAELVRIVGDEARYGRFVQAALATRLVAHDADGTDAAEEILDALRAGLLGD